MLGKADNNLCTFWKLSYSDLKSFTGIGKKKALRLSAFFILARRRNESDAMERIKINDSRVAAEIFKSIMVDLPYEEFWMIMLNKANVVIKKIRISEAGVSGTVVDPKKIFKIALDHHCSSIILGHNHPSGNIQPSEADTKITKKVKDCGILLDISVLDHIIIGGERFYSYADEGAM